MKLSLNRTASLCYVAFALMPVGILAVSLQFFGLGGLWDTQDENMFLFILLAAAFAQLTLAALCFSDRPRRPIFWLLVLGTGLVLAGAWALIAWLPAFVSLIPCWFVWRRYRNLSTQPTTA